MPKNHVWVRHQIERVMVVVDFDENLNIVRSMDPDIKVVFGCDDCGQPLNENTFKEPCLSELDDEMDAQLESATEEGD